MGIRDDIQTDIGEAFDNDLADAVQSFTASYTGPGSWDPNTSQNTGSTITYSGRGVFDSYDNRLVDGLNILVGDVLLICLVNELTGIPSGGHIVEAESLLTGEVEKYRVISPGIDPAKAHYEIQLRAI